MSSTPHKKTTDTNNKTAPNDSLETAVTDSIHQISTKNPYFAGIDILKILACFL